MRLLIFKIFVLFVGIFLIAFFVAVFTPNIADWQYAVISAVYALITSFGVSPALDRIYRKRGVVK